MLKNIIDKIWEGHVVKSKDGYPGILAIDLHYIHEVTSPQAFEELRARGLKVHALDRMLANLDHIVSTGKNRRVITDPAAKNMIGTLRGNCEEFSVKLLDMDSGKQGIVHVVGPELGVTQPGMTIVCGDSHTATHGAFGSIAFGIGTTEVSHVMASSCVLQNKPKTMKIDFNGNLPKGVYAKDLILKLINEIGVGGGAGYIVEYTGNVIRNMNIEERMTICNMSIEFGARAGLIAPDEITFDYLKGREAVVKGEEFERACEYWRTLVSDEGAKFDKVVEIDLSDMRPIVTWGINPGQSVFINENIPYLKDVNFEERELAKKALDYVKLEEGQSLIGVKIDYVFIGSCTNGRISDFREAAKVLNGKKIADNVEVYLVPGSEKVMQMMIDEGLDKIFMDAGIEMRNPGCSMCLAMNEDKVPAGKRCASTSNRNFIGRQGENAISHLMSPAMAAAAAVAGEIVELEDGSPLSRGRQREGRG